MTLAYYDGLGMLGDDPGAPYGSLLTYQGTWQTMPTLNVNTIVSRVGQAVRGYGLQVTNSQNDGGAFTLGNFNVMLTLQVTGSGYGQASDAGSMVDHAYYSVVGRMPVASATFLQSAPGMQTPPPNIPGGIPDPNAPPEFGSWLQNNAWWLALIGAAALILPKYL